MLNILAVGEVWVTARLPPEPSAYWPSQRCQQQWILLSAVMGAFNEHWVQVATREFLLGFHAAKDPVAEFSLCRQAW